MAIHPSRPAGRLFQPLCDDYAAPLGDDLECREELEALRATIDALPDAEREVFVFCVLEGNRYEDAAWTFGRPSDTVRGQVNRAYRRLRARLRSVGHDIPLKKKSKNRRAS